jgi:DNA-directed RNA polymerase specialized sigma24 family protein
LGQARFGAHSFGRSTGSVLEGAPGQAKVLELRYFGGLNVQEINEVLGIAPRTIERDWQFAKSWLTRELNNK